MVCIKMAFVTVNLVDYPRFWYDFVARLAAVDPSAAFHDLDIECYAEIAAAVDKTERGLRTLLTRRGIKVADYDGAAKKAKAEAKAAA